MANYEVKGVSVVSLFKNFPIVFAMLGALIGIFTFFIFPTDLAANLGIGARILSWLIFIVLYTAIMSVGVVVVGVEDGVEVSSPSFTVTVFFFSITKSGSVSGPTMIQLESIIAVIPIERIEISFFIQ